MLIENTGGIDIDISSDMISLAKDLAAAYGPGFDVKFTVVQSGATEVSVWGPASTEIAWQEVLELRHATGRDGVTKGYFFCELGDTKLYRQENFLSVFLMEAIQKARRRVIAGWLAQVHEFVQAGEPRHEHDCNSCVFLGSYQEHDLYYCQSSGTLIARFGEEGEYYSGWNLGRKEFLQADDPQEAEPLAVAYAATIAILGKTFA